MTDFRALCAELVERLDELNCHYNVPSQSAMIERALAALADEPAVPDGREPAAVTGQPSDEEIMGLMPQQMHEDLAYAARAMANEAGTDNRKVKGFLRIALNRHAVDLARAVLARWGNPAPQPVPVSERLPEGRYWGLINGCEAWVLGKGSPSTLNITHWLPAHALPIPHQQENAND